MAGVAAGCGAVVRHPYRRSRLRSRSPGDRRVEYGALIPAYWRLSSAIGHARPGASIIRSFRIAYLADVTGPIALDPSLLAKAAVAGIAFGLVALVFAEANHLLGGWLKRLIPYGPLRPVLGGMAVIGLVYALGTRDYLGLGVTAPDPGGLSIASFFGLEVHPWSWAWKILFTVVTLASGFKGGEVTPLFFIGAALGNALGGLMGAPLDLMAALGFVAVFAGAANTPLACTLMGIELFGATHGVAIAVACFTAYACSGHRGIYLSQRIAVSKGGAVEAEATLRGERTRR